MIILLPLKLELFGNNRASIYVSIFTVCLLLTSCKSIGPKQITLDRYRYNEVLQNTQKEELLTNIVRARYNEPFCFLKPTSITTAYTFNPSLSSTDSVVLTKGTATPYNLALTPGIRYSDEPTITYVPVSTSEFLAEIYRPISLHSLYTLMFGGSTNVNLLLKLSIQYLVTPDIDNASEASKDDPILPPKYKRFYRVLDLFKQLYFIRGVKIIPWIFEGNPTIIIDFVHGFDEHPLAVEIKKGLKLPTNLDKIFLSTKPYPENKAVLQVTMRSIKGMMNFLSHGVRVPPQDIKDHLVNDLQGPNGSIYNFSPLVDDLIKIYYCDVEPSNVFAKTYFHHHWFYIKDSDKTSKITLNYLNIMLLLTGKQLGDQNNHGPVLTLPTR